MHETNIGGGKEMVLQFNAPILTSELKEYLFDAFWHFKKTDTQFSKKNKVLDYNVRKSLQGMCSLFLVGDNYVVKDNSSCTKAISVQ